MILLVGVTGSGMSTTGNCLYNKSGQMNNITDSPFLTSDQASGVTKSFEMISKDGITILDTIGYGGPQYKDHPDVTAEGMSVMLERVDYKVDCVIFVVKKGRFSQEVVEFFREIQEKVLKNKCKTNSILLVTDCSKKGWVDEQKSNEYMKRALKSCQGRFFEFHLKFDLEDDDDNDKMKNLEKRQKAIDQLVRYVDSLDFKTIVIIYKFKQEVEQEKDEDEEQERERLRREREMKEQEIIIQREKEIHNREKAEEQERERLRREREMKEQEIIIQRERERHNRDKAAEQERERLRREREIQEQEIFIQRERERLYRDKAAEQDRERLRREREIQEQEIFRQRERDRINRDIAIEQERERLERERKRLQQETYSNNGKLFLYKKFDR